MDEFIRQLEPWFTAMDERRSSDEISKPRGDIDKMLKAALTKGDSRFFADVPDVEYTVAKKDL